MPRATKTNNWKAYMKGGFSREKPEDSTREAYDKLSQPLINF